MDTKFSSAIHMLILISEAETPMSSEKIAESVGTNPSYIRKIAGLLKKAGIIESSQGRSGFSLTLSADELTLYQIFCAVEETSEIHLFDIHRNPNDQCVVGRYIQPTLTELFGELENKAVSELKQKTLKTCMDLMRDRINKGEGLKKISEIFSDKKVQTSVDEIFSLDDINKAMKKVASGRSKGKTIIKI